MSISELNPEFFEALEAEVLGHSQLPIHWDGGRQTAIDDAMAAYCAIDA